MQFPEIHFGGENPKLHSYKKYFWQPGETRLIEFYPDKVVSVTVLYTTDPSLYEKLSALIDGKPISIDLEWAQPQNHSPHPIELFQFSSTKGTIIVASHENKGYDQIAKFLHSSTFFGKGMSCDKKKLVECLGESFDQIEDIEKTRLEPNNLPINFEALTQMFLGQGTAKFKDHKVQRSDWSVRPLSILQILYGAHDSYAMLQVYNKIIEKYGSEIKIVPKEKSEKTKKKEKQKQQETVKIECHFVNLNEYYNKKKMQINYDSNLEDGDLFSEKPPSLKEQLFKIKSQKDDKIKDEDSCFIENANDLLQILLPGQPKDKRNQSLERICLAADLLLRGIIKTQKETKFRCKICFKFLKDPVALIQHSFSRHLKESPQNLNLDSKDVFLHFFTAANKVKCPFKLVFNDSVLKNITFEEEEDDDDSDDDDIESDNENAEKSDEIVPMTYNKADGIKCCICNKNFDSIESLKNHCWLNHYDFFAKLVTGKGFEAEKEESNKKLIQFGCFCVKQLKIGKVNNENFSIDCSLCNQNAQNPEKFFNHIFFTHKNFAFVNKEQYMKWPLKYSELTAPMQKLAKNAQNSIDFDELEQFHIFDKKNNKCVDCSVSFKNDIERSEHYVNKHLIYFPPEPSQTKK